MSETGHYIEAPMLRHQADAITERYWKSPSAQRFVSRHDDEWSALRDFVDGQTASELDCTKLDILTDMVQARINRGPR